LSGGVFYFEPPCITHIDQTLHHCYEAAAAAAIIDHWELCRVEQKSTCRTYDIARL